MSRIKVLFVCGRNRKRSPTAERIFKSDPRFSIRSAGTSDSSKRRIQQDDLLWADLILVMEPKYAARLQALYPDLSPFPPCYCLDIPDEYEFMDPELIELLRHSVDEAMRRFHSDHHLPNS